MIWDLSARKRKLLRWIGYPVFYLSCLFLFAYLAFPLERVKRSGGPAAGLEVGEIGARVGGRPHPDVHNRRRS